MENEVEAVVRGDSAAVGGNVEERERREGEENRSCWLVDGPPLGRGCWYLEVARNASDDRVARNRGGMGEGEVVECEGVCAGGEGGMG